MAKRRKRSVLLAGSLLTACGAPAHQPDVHPTPMVERDPESAALAALARDAVYHDHVARRTLYSWTTPDQIAELRASRRLLVRDESPAHGASYLDQVLFLLADRGDPVAKLLYTTAFAKMRFAWPVPWSTRAGWPREQYGDQLIRITLKPVAVIVAVSSVGGTFTARNMRDEPVPVSAVLAHPETIAAIYFTSDVRAGAAPGLPAPNATFREYAVCNEAMVESWEVGTDRIAAELAANVATVEAVARYVHSDHPSESVHAPATWATAAAHPSVERAYASALALDSATYSLHPTEIDKLVDLLRRVPRPPAFEGTPALTFAPGVTRKPPRIVSRYQDSFARIQSATAARP